MDVLIVTNDVGKGDWTHEKRGLRVGAAFELVDEVAGLGGKRLFLATVPEFLEGAPRALDITVSARSVDEAQALERTPNPQTCPADWVLDATGVQIEDVDRWYRLGLISELPTTCGLLTWNSIRPIVMLVHLESLDEEMNYDIKRLAVAALQERTPGLNQLVISASRAVWVRRHELLTYLQDAEEEPLYIVDWRLVEHGTRGQLLQIERRRDASSPESRTEP